MSIFFQMEYLYTSECNFTLAWIFNEINFKVYICLKPVSSISLYVVHILLRKLDSMLPYFDS